MNPTLLIAETTPTLAHSQSRLARAEYRLLATAASRYAARWAVARTLPATPDCLWGEINEAEYQYREALKAHAKAFEAS